MKKSPLSDMYLFSFYFTYLTKPFSFHLVFMRNLLYQLVLQFAQLFTLYLFRLHVPLAFIGNRDMEAGDSSASLSHRNKYVYARCLYSNGAPFLVVHVSHTHVLQIGLSSSLFVRHACFYFPVIAYLYGIVIMLQLVSATHLLHY